MRRLILSLLVALMVVSPTAAQTATPTPVPIGTVEQATVSYQRFTLLGLLAFRVTVGRIDGSVADPVDVYMDAVQEAMPGLVEASPPKHGDASRMLTGSPSDGIEMAVVTVQDDDHVFVFVGSGLGMILGDFLPLVETLLQRPVTTLEDWLPVLADMPPGFTVMDDATH